MPGVRAPAPGNLVLAPDGAGMALVCANCHGDLAPSTNKFGEHKGGMVECVECGEEYPLGFCNY